MSQTFENRDMGKTVFHSVNLGGANFTNVNLGGAVFDNINLSDASITNANLANLCIDGAYIKGLTIYGIRVDELIEAELDRRDPERVRLRMEDPNDPACVGQMMERLATLHTSFVEMLRATDPATLTARPDPDQWSVLEILRHVLFAEEMYIRRWIKGSAEPLSSIGLLPTHLADVPSFANVGSQPVDDLETVLTAWQAVRAEAIAFAASVDATELRRTCDTGDSTRTVGQILQGLAGHELDHIREAEAILRAVQTQ